MFFSDRLGGRRYSYSSRHDEEPPFSAGIEILQTGLKRAIMSLFIKIRVTDCVCPMRRYRCATAIPPVVYIVVFEPTITTQYIV